MTDRELMQQALEALERCVATCFDQYAHEQVMSRPEHFVNQNITALREALEHPAQTDWEAVAADQAMTIALLKAEVEQLKEKDADNWYEKALWGGKQEPVAWLYRDHYNSLKLAQTEPPPPLAFPVYTAPPAREWVGLTDEEMHECWDSPLTPLGMKHARAIEAKLKEKNT